MYQLLTPQEMNKADQLTIQAGVLDGFTLMQRAGAAIADVALRLFPKTASITVLCGPGNNGGDGYIAARLLADEGRTVICFATGPSRSGSDAEIAARLFVGEVRPLQDFIPSETGGIIDALYGAGLARALSGTEKHVVETINGSGVPVLAIDLPSGISGDSGTILGAAIIATETVTFFRKKPGHLLQPGRAHCGVLSVADIGILPDVLPRIAPKNFENTPALWQQQLPVLTIDTYKYQRGHAAVFSGGMTSTGAARLSALAAARIGAGAVTLLSPPDALAVNAVHLTSVMLRETRGTRDVLEFVATRKLGAALLGPGYGNAVFAREMALSLLNADSAFHALVLDADGLTAFEDNPHTLFSARHRADISLVLTPHEGEFKRLFGEIATNPNLSKLEKARAAAQLAKAVVIYKGPDTVIAAPDGSAAVNANGTALLATAGSGDVLAGMVCGLLAQGMPAFEAAASAVWMHADAASRFGPGLIAEDLPNMLPKTLSALQNS